MKKIITLSLAVLLCLCLSVTAFAQDYTVPVVTFAEADMDHLEPDPWNMVVTVSDDLQKLYLNGQSYSRADISWLELNYEGWEYKVELTSSQSETIRNAHVETYSKNRVIRAMFYMNDGTEMIVYFLQDDLRQEYDRLVNGDADVWAVEFEYPANNTVTADKAQFVGEATAITHEDYVHSDYYPVYAHTADGTLLLKSGILMNLSGSYYYVPYPEDMTGEKYTHRFYEYLQEHKQTPAVKLTDPGLLQHLDAAQQAYYNDGLGFLQEDTLTEKISQVFLVLVFAIIPGGIAVLFSILALCTKKRSYKKLFWLTVILCVCELSVFAAIANILP